ncbi:hypothetical protein [Bacillus tianshenii]|nr:hypothetical protein [Bacillus tianshenii]
MLLLDSMLEMLFIALMTGFLTSIYSRNALHHTYDGLFDSV